MPLNPDEKPRDFLKLVIAAALLVVRNAHPKEAFEEAERFVTEAERHVGKFEE